MTKSLFLLYMSLIVVATRGRENEK